jgi:uncharacterized membrane protein
MTEVNGLRLAYRGFVAGLAGAYVWIAVAMLAAVPGADPLAPLRVLASIGPDGRSATSAEALVLGLAVTQVVGAAVGIGFAYFFGRFFTVRATLGAGAVCVAVLAWCVLSNRLAAAVAVDPVTLGASGGLLATLGYGLVLGWSVPVRSEVVRGDVARDSVVGAP